MSYELRGNHTLKKHGPTPFKFINEFIVPNLEEKYIKTIPDNLDSPTEGLRKIIDTLFSRFSQIFQSVSDAYYRSHKSGKKEIISSQYQNQYADGEMVQARESFTGNVERLVDKILKNALLKRNVILSPQSKEALKTKYKLSDAQIKKINDWVMDEDNHEELKYFYELVFTNMKVRNESDICQFELPILAAKITGAKKDPELLKAKEIIDHVLISLVGDSKFKTMGIQSLYRARAIIAMSLMINAKIQLCKKI
jgi:hypothetical protein